MWDVAGGLGRRRNYTWDVIYEKEINLKGQIDRQIDRQTDPVLECGLDGSCAGWGAKPQVGESWALGAGTLRAQQ